MMNFLAWIFFGLIAGVIAKLIMPGKDPGGWIVTALLGVGGSYLGGFLGGKLLGIDAGTNEFSFTNMATAIVGAIILLLAYRFFQKQKS